MSNEPNEPKGFSKWIGRCIAVILFGSAALIFLSWYFTMGESQQPAGNASPNTEQAPTQNKPANPGDKKFNF